MGPSWTLHRKLKIELRDLLITRGRRGHYTENLRLTYAICKKARGRCGRDRILVGVTTIYTIGAYHYQSCEFESHSWRGIPDATLCDKVCQ